MTANQYYFGRETTLFYEFPLLIIQNARADAENYSSHV